MISQRCLRAWTGRTVALALTGPLCALPASAQTPGDDGEVIEEIIVESMRRSDATFSEITRSVTLITDEQLNVQSSLERDAGTVLANLVPGFSPSTQALSNYGQQLRGRNFLTLVDGVPQGTPLRNGQRSLQSVDIDAVERIEVLRGGSAVYGFGADGGLVNYITRRPRDGQLNVRGRAGTSFSTVEYDDSLAWNVHGAVSGREDRLDYLVSGTLVERGNTFDADGNRRVVDPLGAQGGLDESSEENVLLKAGYEIDSRQRLEGSFNYFSLRQDPDFGLRSSAASGEMYAPPTEPEVALPGKNQDADPGNETTNLNLVYRREDLGASALTLQTFYQQIDTVFSLFPGFPQTEIESEKLGARATVNTPVELDSLPLDLTWGIDFLGDETRQFEIVGESDATGDQDALAGFLQAELELADRGLLTAGLRHEDVTVDVTGVTPSGKLSGKKTLFNLSGSAFLTDAVTLFGGFSQSFSPGDILRVIGDGSFATTDEVELEFVETDNFEVGVRRRTEAWDFELVGFYSESDNGTSFDADLNILTQPEEIRGAELSAAVRPSDSLEIGGTYSYIEGEVDLDDDGSFEEDLPTTRIPPEKITAYVEYQALERWRLRGRVLYSGTQSNDSTAFGGGNDIEDYALVDVQSTLDVGPGQLDIGVTNLLNKTYLPVINQAYNFQFANVRGPGRRVSLSFRLGYE